MNMITKNRKTLFLGLFLVYFLVPISSNLLALIFANYTAPQFLREADLAFLNQINHENDFWLNLFGLMPFPVVSLVITVYSIPISRLMRSKQTSEGEVEIAKIRIINSPFIISLTGVIGWETATMLSTFRNLQMLPESQNESLALLFIVFASWGFFVFIFSFFTIDYLNRLILIPCFFPEGGLGKYMNASRLSIVSKHLYMWSTISLFPILLLSFGLLNRSHLSIFNLIEILKTDGLFQLAVVLLILSFIMTYFLAKSINGPITKMATATYSIKNQNFDTRVIIHSSDELGVLGDAINDMARGLAERERIKDTFGRIVDPRIRDYLLNNDQMLGGKTVEATILFSDLRDFTNLSEHRTPTEVLHILNRYFQEMSDAIEIHGGFINKFIGDAILAVFGTPLPLESPVFTAVQTARSMAENLNSLNQEFTREGLPVLRMGIGIHTGQVLAGNIGSQSRMEYTVIGDTVNIASRVEGLCKGLGKDLLITEACMEKLPESEKAKFSFLGEFELKGRFSKERIYS